METVDELVNIENKGDSDAKLSYQIVSARIFNIVIRFYRGFFGIYYF